MLLFLDLTISNCDARPDNLFGKVLENSYQGLMKCKGVFSNVLVILATLRLKRRERK
jgi:hypothetical protein